MKKANKNRIAPRTKKHNFEAFITKLIIKGHCAGWELSNPRVQQINNEEGC